MNILNSIKTVSSAIIRTKKQQTLKNGIPVSGHVYAFVTHKDGTRKVVCDQDNDFTESGLDYIHNNIYVNSGNTDPARYIGVSSDTATPTNDKQTTLAGEITTGGLGRARAADTGVAHTLKTNRTTIEHTFEASAVHTAVHKAALFTASVAGTMTNIANFNADETLQAESQLTVIWTIDIG